METLTLDLTAARAARPTVWDRKHRRVTLPEPRTVVPLPAPRPASHNPSAA